MKRLGLAPEAVADLNEIALYIAEDHPERALTFIAELEQKAAQAALRPSSFRERPEIAPGPRAIAHGRYLIFFFATSRTRSGSSASSTMRAI